MRTFRLVLWRCCATAILILGLPGMSQAISISSFGPMGEAGMALGRPLEIGPGGEVFELDAFLSVGGAFALRLSDGLLPSGLDFSFSATLSPDGTDLLLDYSFTNVGSTAVTDIRFLSFLDAQIDDAANGYFNEFALVTGSTDPGQTFEIDEPGYLFGDIVQNLLLGSLDGTNALPPGNADDVSMALSLSLATLAPGQSRAFEVMISEDGDALTGLALIQIDPDPASSTVITFSAYTGVPEASTLLLMMVGFGAIVIASGKTSSELGERR